MVFSGCECGALKTYGFGPGQVGHSHWCPWSPDRYQVPWFCEAYDCVNGVTHCAVDSGGPHYFCQACWDGQEAYQALYLHHHAVKPRRP